MTATSALPFKAMEVPAVEDSMEMASPYQGQVDDFDIDIDLMEDHASNMDSDMVGADDFPNTSQPSLFNDASNDADMADEPSEGSMVDADNFADEDHDIEVQDEDVTYEADMLEGDQDEEIVETVPTIQIEAAVNNDDRTPQLDQDVAEPAEDTVGSVPQAPELPPVEAPLVDETRGPEQEPQLQQQLQQEQHEQDTSLEPRPTEQNQAENPSEIQAADDSANNDHVGLGEEEPNAASGGTAEIQPAHLETSTTEDAEALRPAEAQPPSEPAAVENTKHLERHNVEHDETHDDKLHGTNENESFHPVKVLYQDNEISLFPPLEGDSAETFFLHDEDVAYESVGKLFSSLREVLLDNIADDEVLVIDIDSLGIQLTEVCGTTFSCLDLPYSHANSRILRTQHTIPR